MCGFAEVDSGRISASDGCARLLSFEQLKGASKGNQQSWCSGHTSIPSVFFFPGALVEVFFFGGYKLNTFDTAKCDENLALSATTCGRRQPSGPVELKINTPPFQPLPFQGRRPVS